MRISSLLTLCILSVSSVHGKFGVDSSVCDVDIFARRAALDTGPKRPTLPQQWTVLTEANNEDRNFTQDILESYDGINKRGALVQYQWGVKTQKIFQYSLNQLITLQFDDSGNPPRCKVEVLSKSNVKDGFGLIGTDIFSLNKALRISGTDTEVYIGRATVRDAYIVDAWESCKYVDTLDGTFHLIWFFSANNTWTSAINQVVPVELQVSGIVHVNVTHSYPVSRQYFFTDFRPAHFSGTTDVFNVPPMTYCPNIVSTHDPPKIANSLSFSSEIVTPMQDFVDFIDEYYDGTHKLARFDRSVDSQSGKKKQMTQVLDYNTGIVYNIEPSTGTCHVTAINATSMGVVKKDRKHLGMASPLQLIQMNNMTRTYMGKRKARGFTCDVFAGIKPDPGSSRPTLYEWYYASREWMENTGDLLQSNQLVMFQITSHDFNSILIYNVFDYKEEQQDIWATDVTACFNYTQRERVTVSFPGSAKGNVSADVDGFKYAVVTSASNLAGIAPLRITELQIDNRGKNINVSFYVLDSPVLSVNVITSSPVVSLSDAVSKLKGLISEGAFVVMLPNFVPIYSIKS